MSIDYDLFVIKSGNKDTTHSQLRDCIADAIENLKLRIEMIENGNKKETEPDEPLIKDEDKLDAVEAFFELLDITDGIYFQSLNNCFYHTDDDGIAYSIDFDNDNGIDNLDPNRSYTITELCGKETE